MDPRFSPELPRPHPHPSSQSSHERSRSHNRKLFIQRNSQQQQQIVIPYWDEQTSSAHFHLLEQIRLLKKKNAHFESHMGRMKAQYQQLRTTLQIMDQNQRQHMRRYAQLTQRYNIAVGKIQELKGEVEILRAENGELLGDLRARELREEELRKKMGRLREQECGLGGRVMELEEELRVTRLRNQEERKVLEKSKHSELQMLRNSLQGQFQAQPHQNSQHQQKILELSQIIVELKTSVGDRDSKIHRLQKQNQQLSEQCRKFKNQQFQKPNTLVDTHSLTNFKEIQRLKTEINELKVQIIKLTDQKNYLQMKINKEEAKAKEGKQKYKEKQLRMKKSNQIMINIGSQRDGEINVQQYNDLLEKLRARDEKIRQLNDKLASQESKVNEKEKYYGQIITTLTINLQQSEKANKILKEQLQLLKTSLIQAQNDLKQQQKPSSNKQIAKQSQQDDKTLTQLQAQYNSELQALRRLILYKKYPQSSSASTNEAHTRIRQQYQHKFDLLVTDYQQLQKQLLLLQQQLLHTRHTHAHTHDSAREVITFRTSQQERIIYLQAIRKWEIAYEELSAITEAKLVSKDEEINLLNLRLVNRGDCYGL